MNLPQFTEYDHHVRQMVDAALAAANPATAVAHHLHLTDHILTCGDVRYPLGNGRIYLVSMGKAAMLMARAAVQIIGDHLTAGVGITKQFDKKRAKPEGTRPFRNVNFTLFEANHPVSGDDSVRATLALTEMLAQTAVDDLVIFLISGGTSALVTQPRVPMPIWQQVNQALLDSGCDILEFNTVRRHLDAVKGGGLAQMAAPATVVSLILSDVVGNHLEAIGSGPTAPEPNSPADALEVLQRYHIANQLSPEAVQLVTETLAAGKPETAVTAHNIIIGDIRMAGLAAVEKASQIGFHASLLTAQLEGEAREVGRMLAAIAKDAVPNQAIILGGETTVAVRGKGIGGRNLEAALAAAIALENNPHIVIATLATDGDDGTSGVAGAFVTGSSVANGRSLRLNARTHLDNNDSFTYFRQLEQQGHKHLIHTGPTGTNLNDLLFILRYA